MRTTKQKADFLWRQRNVINTIIDGGGDGDGGVVTGLIPTLNIVTAAVQSAVAGNHYVLTNIATTTVTLPSTPESGDLIWITVGNGLLTNVVARNGSNIQSIAEDLILNASYAAVQMRYIDSTIGWTFV
jgi:hypothetical protein